VAAISALPTAGRFAGLAGLVVLAVGCWRGRHWAVSAGAAGLLAGVFVAGLDGAPVVAVVVGVGATVLAWDAGGTAIDLGAQLGREAPTARLEAVHAAGSLVVAAAAGGLGAAVYLVAGGGRPMAGLALLLVAGVALVVALDRA